MVDVPSSIVSGDPKFRKGLLTAVGRWKLDSPSGTIRLDITSVSTGPHISLPYGAQLYYSGSKKDIELYYFLGDPDEGNRVVFRKE